MPCLIIVTLFFYDSRKMSNMQQKPSIIVSFRSAFCSAVNTNLFDISCKPQIPEPGRPEYLTCRFATVTADG